MFHGKVKAPKTPSITGTMRRSALHDELESFARAESNRRVELVRAADRDAAHETQPAKSEVMWIPYGPSEEELCVEIAADIGAAAAEYAAIRRGVGVMDSSQRGVVEVRGAQRIAFLQRMVTQDISKMVTGDACESFWLNRKGRIEADMCLCEFTDCMRIDLDRFVAKDVAQQLQAFVFDEDVSIRDASDECARLSLHGSATLRMLAELGIQVDALRTNLRVVSGVIAGHDVWCARRDQTGEVGVEVFCATADVAAIWRHMLDHGLRGDFVVRPVGWSAFNAARIEGGTPLFLVDFGKANLPHETGVLARRVSFKKGCYLGQEVVARMESLGKPKQILRALRVQGEAIPVSGAQIFAPSQDGAGSFGDCIGAVTSSTPAPMLGSAGIAFGMIKNASAAVAGEVVIAAEGELTRATIQETLSFLPESKV